PILWHCTAGKDRAGYAAALLLKLLDVPQETIVVDYMLSAKYARPPRKMVMMLRTFRGAKAVRLIKPMYGVSREWILSTFHTIEEHWGSFEAYTHDALGLTAADILQLRELYTEEI
ncbi:MAG: tyrosine-protein phosphatase, partial [Anaerolineae bacterium]|nr:tyrosine-protein phosphatase [Anaerolineae bacterium]